MHYPVISNSPAPFFLHNVIGFRHIPTASGSPIEHPACTVCYRGEQHIVLWSAPLSTLMRTLALRDGHPTFPPPSSTLFSTPVNGFSPRNSGSQSCRMDTKSMQDFHNSIFDNQLFKSRLSENPVPITPVTLTYRQTSFPWAGYSPFSEHVKKQLTKRQKNQML